MHVITWYAFNAFSGTWKWLIYTRTQNVNRTDKICDDSSPPKKEKEKIRLSTNHQYPAIPSSADDEVSNNINSVGTSSTRMGKHQNQSTESQELIDTHPFSKKCRKYNYSKNTPKVSNAEEMFSCKSRVLCKAIMWVSSH